MPSPGKAWYHITLGTHASWLPGDPRGFRVRQHRIHSSGDHRAPPPPGEHRGLHVYHQEHSVSATVIPMNCRVTAGQSLVDHLLKLGHRVLAVSVGGMHAHVLVELPIDHEDAKHEVVRSKHSAALAVKDRIPGKLWAKGMGLKRIKDRAHQRNVYRYIVKHRKEGAWVWVFNQ